VCSSDLIFTAGYASITQYAIYGFVFYTLAMGLLLGSLIGIQIGALTTKVIPFALIGAAVAADLPGWTVWVLVAVGVISVITDVVWSTKSSDWKKFRRERSFAQTS